MTATVSQASQQRPREGMRRLLTGAPQHTDGRLTKNNLWREAQVSRATMNRAGDILAEWDAQTGASPATATARRQDDDLDRVRDSLQASRAQCRKLQNQVDAAATLIAALAAENAALRRQAADSQARAVIPLSRSTATRE
jgi:hypothetical protein